MRKGSSARETAHRRRRLLTAVVSVLNVLLLVLVVAVCLELARVVRASWQRPTTPCRDSTSWPSKGSSSTPPNAVTSSSSGRQAQGRGPEDDAGLTQVLPEDAAFCLPCSAVYLTSLEVRQNLRRFRQRGDEKGDEKGDALLCCTDHHDNLQILLTTYTEVQYRTALAKGELRVQDIPENKTLLAESHLRLSYDTNSELQDVNDSHIIPLTIQGGEFSNTSVIFHNGKTSVNNAGHYYIYSHVPFNFPSLQSSSSSPPSSPSTASYYHTLKQEVVKVRNGGEETVLLENSVVPCDLKSKQSCRQHSFVAGIFLLEERDSILLRVSDPRLVEKGNELQFGLHRI